MNPRCLVEKLTHFQFCRTKNGNHFIQGGVTKRRMKMGLKKRKTHAQCVFFWLERTKIQRVENFLTQVVYKLEFDAKSRGRI